VDGASALDGGTAIALSTFMPVKRTLRRAIDWKAGLWAGVIAGAQ
jgi:hypothetical protein